MATITLRAYLEELNTLIEQEALEEVIGHCRHILQYFPKNLETYRLLGKALLEKARYDEAAQVFPRILSADPTDFVAHVGLSSVYENQNEVRRALWHMERAFEQKSNNPTIADEIRRLYAAMGKTPPQKIKMSRGALAKQYASNGRYDQALNEVRQALQENPQRIDLKILLAETLWQANYPVEAGEAALEILQAIPDSLAANTLMAKLWLVSQRPDDAKIFLKHVEDLAPYESLKLIYQANNQKATVPDTAFTIARLDWTTAAASGFGDESPDWVSKISDVFQMTDDAAVTGAESFGETTEPVSAIDDNRPSPFGEDDIPDWVTGTGSLSENTPTTTSEDLPDWFAEGADFGTKPQTGELSAPEEWFNELSDKVSQTGPLSEDKLPPATEDDSKPFVSGFTGMLSELGDDDAADDLDALRSAASAPSQSEIDSLIASARGENALEIDGDEALPPNWLDNAVDEPDWGSNELDNADDFTPDWFSGDADSDDEFATLLDDDSEDEVDLFGDFTSEQDADNEFATLFGEGDELAEPADNLVGMFGTDGEIFNTDLFSDSEAEDATSEEFALFSEDDEVGADQGTFALNDDIDTEDDDLAPMFGDISDEMPSEGFATLFGEGDLDDESDLFGSTDEPSDDLAGMFGDSSSGLHTGWLTEPDEDSTPKSSTFDNVLDEEPDLDNLFSSEVEGLDTSWLSGGDAVAEPAQESASDELSDEPDLENLFGDEVEVDTSFLTATGFSEADSGSAEEEPDLDSLFGSEVEGLDTSWLSGGDAIAEPAQESASDELSDEPDLESLFGDEVQVDTSFLTATGFSETDSGSAEEEPDLDSLFGSEVEGLDTSWLSGGDALAEPAQESASDELSDEPDLASLFGDEVEVDTSFLTATGFSEADSGSVEEEPDLDSLFSSEVKGLDTSWLSGGDAVSESEPETNGFDLGAEPEFDLLGEDTLEFETDNWMSSSEEDSEEFDTLFADDADAIGDSIIAASEEMEAAVLHAAEFEEDDEDSEEFDTLFAGEIGINTGFLSSAGFEDDDMLADLTSDADAADDAFDLDAMLGDESAGLVDTSWLSSSETAEPAEFATSGDEDFATMFSEDNDEPEDALFEESEDWLRPVDTSALTTEEVDSLDTLLEDSDLPEPTVDDLAELFDDEGITVDTSFLRSMDGTVEDELVIAESDLDDPADDDFGALFDSPSGATGFLQTSALVEPDDSVIDEFLADAQAEAQIEEETELEAELEATEAEVSAELGDALFADISEGEESLDLDSLFGGGALADFTTESDDGDDVLLRQTKEKEDDASGLDDFFSEIDESTLESEPDLEDFFDPADLDFVTSEVQTVSVADHVPNELENFMDSSDAVSVESVEEEDLDAIFGAFDTSAEPDFAELLETEDSLLDTDDVLTSDSDLDGIFADETDFANLLDDEDDLMSFLDEESTEAVVETNLEDLIDAEEAEDDFTSFLDEDSLESVSEVDFDTLLDGEDDLFGEFELDDELDSDLVTADDLGDLLAEDGAQALEDDLFGDFDLDDDLITADDLGDLLAEDSGSMAEVDSISVDEFASVFDSAIFDDEDDASSSEPEPEFGEAEELAEIDDDLFTAITSGGETIGLIEDSELAEELDWVTGFDEETEEGALATMEASMPAPPVRLPDTPRVQFAFKREPRWMRVLKNKQSANIVGDVEHKFEDSGLFDTFDELLDDDLLDDDLTDWLE